MTTPEWSREVWCEHIVFDDGHMHDEAKSCRHRWQDACLVCCPECVDRMWTIPDLEDESETSDRGSMIVGLVAVGLLASLIVVGVATFVWAAIA